MAKKKETKRTYYSLDRILEQNAMFNIIYGGKGNGKTTAVLEELLKEYCEEGKQFVLLRKYDLDIKASNMKLVFADIVARGKVQELTNYQYNNITYYQRAFYLSYTDDSGKVVKESNPFCYVFSNSMYYRNNGVQLVNVWNVLLDEFVDDNVDDNEVINFLRNISTFKRRKPSDKFKVYLCGNSIDMYCPYFDLFGVKAEQLEKGNIYVIENDLDGEKVKVAIEYCDNSNIASTDNNFFNMFTKYSPRVKMILDGSWELNACKYIADLGDISNADELFTFYVIFKDMKFRGDILQLEDGNQVIVFKPKTTDIKDDNDTIIYNPNKLELKPKINYLFSFYQVIPQLKVTSLIADLIARNQYYAANASTGNTIEAIIKQM